MCSESYMPTCSVSEEVVDNSRQPSSGSFGGSSAAPLFRRSAGSMCRQQGWFARPNNYVQHARDMFCLWHNMSLACYASGALRLWLYYTTLRCEDGTPLPPLYVADCVGGEGIGRVRGFEVMWGLGGGAVKVLARGC